MLRSMTLPEFSRISADGVRVDAALPSQRLAALELALGCVDSPGERSVSAQCIIDRAVAQCQRGRDDWRGLLVARIATAEKLGEQPDAEPAMVGAILVTVLAGRVASVATPQTTPDAPAETGGQLVRRAAEHAEASGAVLVQALLDPADNRAIAAFSAAGFRHTADLLFMVARCNAGVDNSDGDNTTAAVNDDGASVNLEWQEYRGDLHPRLSALVERTYEGSRDCPELDGVRAIDDILAGYRETGEFATERWLIAVRNGRDVACLLLADHPADDQWELVYLGVAPEFRGQGLGLVLTRHALAMTRRAGRQQLVLAVDAANDPATAIYRRAGFTAWERRIIFLRRFDNPREI